MSIRCIVLDACLAGCAGSRRDANAQSLPCRNALEAIRQGDFLACFTQTSMAEWRRHRGLYAQTWLTSMFARRRVRMLEHVPQDRSLRKAVSTVKDAGVKAKMLADLHLVEAALATDGLVLSTDARMRAHLRALTSKPAVIARLQWALANDPECLEWLQSGAIPRPSFGI